MSDHIATALRVMREHEPEIGYYGLFSGGKDSVVLKELARLAGVKVRWNYNNVTIDPPELVRFIKRHHPDVVWRNSKHGNLFAYAKRKRHLPSRRARWCCDTYKEHRPPKGELMLSGIRAEESPRRREAWTEHRMYHKRSNREMVLPILLWDSEQVWDFIRDNGIPYCELYDEGFHRLGCVGCPLASEHNRDREFKRWPRYEQKWRDVARHVWDARKGTLQKNGKPWFGSAWFDSFEDFWQWWRRGHR